MKNFRTNQLAIKFYHESENLKLRSALKNQFDRASSSVVLNLAEGSGKFSPKDKRRFYHIAFGSLRECESILTLARVKDENLIKLLDKLAAHLYKLIKAT